MKEKLSFVDRVVAELINEGICSVAESKILAATFEDSAQEHFDIFLLEEETVGKEQLLKMLSNIYQVPLFDVNGYFFDHELLLLFPKDFLKKHIFIPISEEGETLSIVMNDPENLDALEEIGNYVSHNVDIQVGLSDDILAAIEEYYSLDVVSDSTEEDDFSDEVGEEDSDIVDFI